MIREIVCDEILKDSREMRLVGLRWDLVQWALVLDTDLFVREGDVFAQRLWIVCDGVGSIDFPLINTRLPLGLWLYQFNIVDHGDQFKIISFKAQIPHFDNGNDPNFSGQQEISIECMNVTAVLSEKIVQADEYRFVKFSDRQIIASDEELKEFVDQM